MPPMTKIETLAWLDGDILPVQEVRVSPLAHSLHYGTGVFEGMRCYAQEGGGGGIFRLQDHLARLYDSARILGYEIPYSAEDLGRAVREVLRRNRMDAAYIRPLAFLGEGQMGVAGGANPVHVLIAVWHWGAYLGEEGMKKGIRVHLCSYERATGNASAQRAKITGQYVTSFMAKREARALGLDESLLLDRDGYLCEASGENLFIVQRGVLCTAPDSSPILHGITRDTILSLAGDLGIPVRLERFTRGALFAADEAFLTGTAAEVTPIREAGGRALKASPGPVTSALQETYLALVRGNGARAAQWITRV
jgi:branched-chain amino acid aminotransferase